MFRNYLAQLAFSAPNSRVHGVSALDLARIVALAFGIGAIDPQLVVRNAGKRSPHVLVFITSGQRIRIA